MAGLILKNFKNQLDKFVNSSVKNVKKAAASAINDVAWNAKNKALPAEFAKNFTVRNKKFPNTSRYTKATPENLNSTITYPFDFMELHTIGGTKTPERNRMLAVPMPDLLNKSFRGANGKIKKSYKPSSLLAYNNSNKVKTKGKKSQKAHAFLLRSKAGTPFIAKRKSKTSRSIELLYWLTNKVGIKRSWDYGKIVKRVYKEIFDRKFNKWLKFYDEKDLENKK